MRPTCLQVCSSPRYQQPPGTARSHRQAPRAVLTIVGRSCHSCKPPFLFLLIGQGGLTLRLRFAGCLGVTGSPSQTHEFFRFPPGNPAETPAFPVNSVEFCSAVFKRRLRRKRLGCWGRSILSDAVATAARGSAAWWSLSQRLLWIHRCWRQMVSVLFKELAVSGFENVLG